MNVAAAEDLHVCRSFEEDFFRKTSLRCSRSCWTENSGVSEAFDVALKGAGTCFIPGVSSSLMFILFHV